MFICSEIKEVNNCLDEKRMLIEQKKSVNLKNEVYKNTKNHEIFQVKTYQYNKNTRFIIYEKGKKCYLYQ